MTSRTTERFRSAYANLPDQVRRRVREAYRRFRDNPRHPSLQFRQVHTARPIYSARVGLGYRALAVIEGELIIWFWIGTHAEY
ncbi:MAG: hypothetical protein DME10_10700, partial [Candidatus Rokuibacteriota bacterium]